MFAKFKKGGWWALAAMLSICLLTAAPASAAAPVFGGTLNVAMDVDIKSLNPYSLGWQSHEVLRQIFEGLVEVDDGMGIIPGLAYKWDISPDGLTYTFHLRKGVKFHNGQEMTAEDVKASLDLLRRSAIKDKFKTMRDVEIVDPYTVRVTLSKLTATFLINLANPETVGIMPKSEIEKEGDNIQHPIGTGPFMFEKWIPDRYVILKRFPDYWGGEGKTTGTGGEKTAYVNEIVFRPMTERAVRVSALEAGDIDLCFIPSDQRKRLEADPNIVIKGTGPTFEFWNFWFNCKPGRPFSDLNLRKAFAYAVNRHDMLIATNGGTGSVTNSAFPKFSFWYTKHMAHAYGPRYNPEKAKEYLKKSHYKGQVIKIITSKGYAAMDKQAVVAQAELERVGIHTELEYLDWSSLFAKYKSGDFDVVSYGYGAHADPDFFYSRLTSQNTFNGWHNARFDQLVAAARATTDVQKRKALYDQAHEILNQQIPLMFTFSEEYFYGLNKRVHGFKPWGAVFMRLWNVWLTK